MKLPKEELPLIPVEGVLSYEENLPYPYVHYSGRFGVFSAFQKNREGKIYFCSCQKQSLQVYISYANIGFDYLPKSVRANLRQMLADTIQFKKGICHVCNKAIPKFIPGKSKLNSTKFDSIYGNYIKVKQLEFGVSPSGFIYESGYLPIGMQAPLITEGNSNRLDEQSRFDLYRYCENIIREKVGYHLVGQKWSTEIKLLQIVKKLYPNYNVIHQYEIDHLRIDIYVEELNLAIEYQGEQHFKVIGFMGGKEGLNQRIKRDKEKAEICKYYNINLIYFTYKDKLSDTLVKNRINEHLKLSKSE
ncbi:hypothetical protein IEO70_16270 [Bacillus sp. AGMB 02131]|uniref:DUF2726 domain-containing protein n=1 Tax=Peribacillus faecalis TaxID=2772559 RepID=A0A927HCU7_9BACI|nr:hypothetical protein [Peribacillus faecalis]MBD3109896.1 hypothetical protein [Peribacillus faecalis]